jgi:hypothetical protein
MRLAIFLAALLPIAAWSADQSCRPPIKLIVDEQGLCLEKGLSVGYQNGGSAKVLCLESAALRNACGSDGALARRRAFSLWLNKVKDFESDCAGRGGEFVYEEPGFQEPSDQTFCAAAEPDTVVNMLEDTLCNYRSACPSTPVSCNFPCSSKT